MNTFCEQPIRETKRDSGCVVVEDDRDAVKGEARLCVTGRRRFGSRFGNILKFAFELKNMVCRIFWPKASDIPRSIEIRPPLSRP
jgi:hypothetical protein